MPLQTSSTDCDTYESQQHHQIIDTATHHRTATSIDLSYAVAKPSAFMTDFIVRPQVCSLSPIINSNLRILKAVAVTPCV